MNLCFLPGQVIYGNNSCAKVKEKSNKKLQ